MPPPKEVYNTEKCVEVTTYVSAGEKIKDPSITEKYYDLVTDFYEVGWGKSFHFAPQRPSEKKEDAMLRYELKLADALQLKPGMKVLDVGCGVGGPMANIAKKSGATIVGLNINAYQVKKAKEYVKKIGLDAICSFHLGNFMDTKLPPESFDAIYAIEATPHAPDKTACFKELYRLLKPGGYFSGYEYCVLDSFDQTNRDHTQIMEDLEHGGGLQKVPPMEEIKKAFLDAGFTVLALQNDCTEGLSWSLPLERGFRRTKFGRLCTDVMVRVLEKVGVAPKGSAKVGDFLNLGAEAFVQAEKRGLFTPNLFFLVQKPKD